jgi:hypothetical protein
LSRQKQTKLDSRTVARRFCRHCPAGLAGGHLDSEIEFLVACPPCFRYLTPDNQMKISLSFLTFTGMNPFLGRKP